MCGINLQVLRSPPVGGDDVKTCRCSDQLSRRVASDNVRRRGPDMCDAVTLHVEQGRCNVSVFLQASVLQMRHKPIQQPVKICCDNSDQNASLGTNLVAYLCWNGEVYQTIERNQTTNVDESDVLSSNKKGSNTSASDRVNDVWYHSQSDTMLVATEIATVLSNQIAREQKDSLKILGAQTVMKHGRERDPAPYSPSHRGITDIMGRMFNAEFAFLVLTSEAIYYGRDKFGRRSLIRWECPVCGSFQITSVAEQALTTVMSTCMPTNQDDIRKNGYERGSETRVNNCDSTITEWCEIEPGKVFEYRFDSNSVAVLDFAKFDSNLVDSANHSTDYKLQRQTPSLPAPDGVSEQMWKASFLLEDILTSSVSVRLDYHGSRPPAAILFSGGLDSVVMAALAIRTAANCSKTSGQPILLSNVSFGPEYAKSADRKAALVSFQVLQKLFPNQQIVFEDIVVHWEDIVEEEARIRALLNPKTTLMDLNIATALWFASRGQDVEGMERGYSPDEASDTNNSPRVLLVGMGADEQLGGYGRHRKAFEKSGWDGLREELNLDLSRLWERNLGRDDRICSDHGKEARFPFLDPRVVQLLQDLPLECVCDFALPPGQGDKRLLRLVAMRLGLDHASGLVKRAIQFGSRISHVSDAKRFGSRRQAKGQKTVAHKQLR